jgi:hypothetical protein
MSQSWPSFVECIEGNDCDTGLMDECPLVVALVFAVPAGVIDVAGCSAWSLLQVASVLSSFLYAHTLTGCF